MVSIVALEAFVGVALLQITPLLLPAIGETFAELSGVFNIGLEGVMLFGAIAAFFTDAFLGSPYLGLLVAALIGLALGLMIAAFEVNLRVNQIVFGIGILLLGVSLTSFIAGTLTAELMRSARPIEAGLLPRIGLFPADSILSVLNQNVLFYLALALIPVGWFVLFRTRFGLAVRMIGEAPSAADYMGLKVFRTRYLCLMIGSVLAAVGGAFLIIGTTGVWVNDVTGGVGFIIIALVRLSGWRPQFALVFIAIFSVIEAFQFFMQASYPGIPYEFIEMLPYFVGVLSLLLAYRFRFSVQPASLGQPYSSGEK